MPRKKRKVGPVAQPPPREAPERPEATVRRPLAALESASHQYEIAKSINLFLVPLDPSLGSHDLSQLTKASSTLHHAFAPFLFRSMNLEHFYSDTPLAAVVKRREIAARFFADRLRWRPEVYELVQYVLMPPSDVFWKQLSMLLINRLKQ